MATSSDPRVRVTADELFNGHNVLCEVPVRVVTAMKSEPFQFDCSINCPGIATIWRMAITYGHRADTGDVACSVSFERTDNQDGHVMVFAMLSYVDRNGRFVRFPKLLRSGEVSSGETLQGCIGEKRHRGFRSYIFSLGLSIRISLYIRNCHSGMSAKACSSPERKETLRSKL